VPIGARRYDREPASDQALRDAPRPPAGAAQGAEG